MKKVVLILSLAGAGTSLLSGAGPTWWTARQVTNGSSANDFAVANIGQAKNMAAGAILELDDDLPGGAGQALNDLLASWLQAPATGVTRNDYAAINQGQLKNLAKLFYDRLSVVGFQGPPLSGGQTYPWPAPSGSTNDFAAANLGNLKYLFSFDPLFSTSGDGVPDAWKRFYGLSLTANLAAQDTDGDGISDLAEYLAGTNPTNSADKNHTTPAGYDVVVKTNGGSYYAVSAASCAITPTAP